MKEISLTKGKFAIVDDDDFEYLSQWKWFINTNGYAQRTEGSRGSQKKIYMHRVINETPEDMSTDHINGNRLDNRRENLRSVTLRQNKLNSSKHTRNKTGYKGVSLQKNTGKYVAYIRVNNKGITIGTYSTVEEAAKAYNRAALHFFGEYAKLNDV